MKNSAFCCIASAMVAGTVAFGPVAAGAAPATQEEAKRIQEQIERYVGKPRPTGPAATVTPAGEGYSISISIEELVRPLATFGITATSAPAVMTATPRADGLWSVTQQGMPEVQVKVNAQSIRILMEGVRYESIYDPRYLSFMSARMTQTGLQVDSVAPGFMNVRRLGPSENIFALQPAGSKAVSGAGQYTTQSSNESFRITEGGKDISITVATGKITGDATVDTFQIPDLMELWAFFVANPSASAIEERVEELKGLVRTALPVFNTISQQVSVSDVAVASPVGNFGLKEGAFKFNTTGLRKDGDLGLRFSFAGFALPQGLLPAWTAPLLPSDVVMDFGVKGHDFETLVLRLLEAAQPNSPPGAAEAAGRDAVMEAFPDGKVKVSMRSSRLASSLLDITFDGEMTILKPVPMGKLTVRAKGVDAALEHLQKNGAGDQMAVQASIFLMAAKGFGRAEPDGTLVWVIENPDGGMPKINGVAIPGGK